MTFTGSGAASLLITPVRFKVPEDKNKLDEEYEDVQDKDCVLQSQTVLLKMYHNHQNLTICGILTMYGQLGDIPCDCSKRPPEQAERN